VPAAQSDLEIAPGSLAPHRPGGAQDLHGQGVPQRAGAPDVSVLQLRLPAGQRAKFRAGQYLQVSLPDGSRARYSMANPPHESDAVTLHVRHVPGGAFSARVPQLAAGELLDIELPFGAFSLREEQARPWCSWRAAPASRR
jgi:NAD(P)H-flavin reductase